MWERHPGAGGTQRVRSFVGNLLLSDGGKVEQAISQVGLTFHMLSEASSSIVFNGCSEREPDSSLLNAELSGLADRYLNRNVVSFPAVSRVQCHPGEQTSILKTHRPHGSSHFKQAMACVLGYYNIKCSVWLWKNQAGTLLKTHLEAMGSTAHLSS